MVRKRKPVLVAGVIGLVVVLFIVLFLGACAPAPATTSTSPTTQAQTQQKAVIAVNSTNFDCVGGDVATGKSAVFCTLAYMCYDSLVIKDKDNKLQPALAESWQWGPDYKSITFKLKKGIKFHNGDPFTAQDVKFSMETYKRPDKPSTVGAELRRQLVGVDIADDYTVTLRFTEVYLSFFDRLVDYWFMLPKDYYAKDEAYFASHPVGTGPYRWLSYQQDTFVEWEAAQNHYRHTPETKNVRMVWVPEPSTRLAMLKTGEADIVPLAYEHVKEVTANPSLKMFWNKNTNLIVLGFGDMLFPDKKLPFMDTRVRQAASLAIDRKTIVDKVMSGGGMAYGDLIPPWLPGYDPKYAAPDPYDPEKAKALLKEAGYPNGFETQIISTLTYKSALEAAGTYLDAVGIKTKVRILETGAWSDIVMNKTETGLVENNHFWNAKTNLDSILGLRFTIGSQWGYVWNQKTDTLAKKLKVMLPDDQMATLSRQVVEDIKAENTGIILWSIHGPVGVGPRVEYWENVNGRSGLGLFEYLRLKK